MTIGQRIKTVREDARLKPGTFANKIGITRTHLVNLENDTSKPGVEIIEKIVTTFDVDVKWLVTGVEKMKEPPAGRTDDLFVQMSEWMHQVQRRLEAVEQSLKILAQSKKDKMK
jgi:transcriptional regulator with XRE-family HTH domain